ncbi:MAG: FAD-dependent oxidoreductase [Dissulfurispiraceae bacterium]|jgi:heterodisulfide reductase subunit A-like polyferredoxin|nr:FAD-dependent oxidoreductase [Dissulfurispiraceae bacterium]
MSLLSDSTKRGSVLVVGGGIGGMQTSLDLADAGFKVHIIQKESSIGGIMSMLDKTFPTGDCAMCMISPKMVDVGRHLNIDIHSCSELVSLEGEAGNFKAVVREKARYVDLAKCTGCEACVLKCPVQKPSEFNQGLAQRTAINRRYAQAVPGGVAIDKEGVSPCRMACPAEVNAHAYVVLTAEGRFSEALEIVRKNNPFPAVTGRVCNHPCETECRRGDLDEPVSICSLKRFLTDYEDAHGGFKKPDLPEQKLEKVAVIGSGPAGMTCARDLALKGYRTTVFEKEAVAGGMLALSIPAYRLPKDIVQKEIDAILSHDIELKTGLALGRDFSIDDLKVQGYKAVFIAVGTHRGVKLRFEGQETTEGVLDSLDFLRRVNLGESVDIGKKVVVLGGGNVAVDVALTAARLGAEEIRIVCLEKCDEMPAHKWEIDQVLEEGIRIENSWGMNRIVAADGKIKGIEVKQCVSLFDDSRRFNPQYDECSLNFFQADTVIFAVGMGVEDSFKTGIRNLEFMPDKRIRADLLTCATGIDGVFAGGDCVYGPTNIITAIASGRDAAESIHRYLRNEDMYADRPKLKDRQKYIKDITDIKKEARLSMAVLPVAERKNNFKEVFIGYTEEQAIKEASRCMSCSGCCECMLCIAECEAKAINHFMEKDKLTELDVGAVILSPGLDTYDPKVRGELGYGRWPNVVTSLQFERILSASGPYQGVVQRLSDNKHPVKVAWIQCVGSRDPQNANPWCSSVCCMYATKQAIIAKEHDNNIEPTIFYMEMRSYGKDFDKYVERAKKEYGVRYIRSMISAVREDSDTKNLLLRYAQEDGTLTDEPFDMVVLSVGLQPHKDAEQLAGICGIDTNEYQFPLTSTFEPVQTSRPGVFVTGIYQGPKDIPETVMQGSAVAGQAMSLLSDARWTETITKELPEEKDISGQEPRIGVFVCHCGINIAGTVDVKKVVEEVKDLPNVAHAENLLYSCSQDSQEKIKQLIKEKNLNRVLVASCTPRTHEGLFQDTIREAGLNKYMFDLADIREQCSWCHMGQKEAATKKAEGIVKMSIAKSRLQVPLKSESVEVNPACLIIGAGLAGMTSALLLADQGFKVHLIEKEVEPGGLLKNVCRTIDGLDLQKFLAERIDAVKKHPDIILHTGTEVKHTDGFVGNFRTILTDGTELEHGAVILSTGGIEYQPTEYLYGQSSNVITQRQLEQRLSSDERPKAGETYVMIQCVGSREEPNQYCSRICCQDAIKNAVYIKQTEPAANVVILYRDIRTYGLREDYYKKARDLGVVFIRYDLDCKPVVKQNSSRISVSAWDYMLDKEITINADHLVLSTGLRPHPSTEQISSMYKVTRNMDGYYLEAHVKLRPVDIPSEGLFVAGLGHAPKNIDETISQAMAAAGRAGVLLSHEKLAVSGIIAKHKRELCMSCLSCMRVCPFGSPYIDADGRVSHNEVKCMGCGICAGICPAKAFQVNNFRDDQIMAMVDAAAESGPGVLN